MSKFRENFDFNPEELKIIEVYSSIQGEGLDIGKEVVFVRTSGCSLSCVWCDTKHSWTGKNGYSIRPADLMEEVIREHKGSKNVVITGGEPLIQPTQPLIEFVAGLKNEGFNIAWETNGFHLPHPMLIRLTNLFSVSPKLSSSKQPTYSSDLLNKWADNCEHKIQFKFVISDIKDMEEVVRLINGAVNIKKKFTPIIFQPEESMDKDIYTKLPIMAKHAFSEVGDNILDYRVRYIPQVHKHYKIR